MEIEAASYYSLRQIYAAVTFYIKLEQKQLALSRLFLQCILFFFVFYYLFCIRFIGKRKFYNASFFLFIFDGTSGKLYNNMVDYNRLYKIRMRGWRNNQ